MTWTSPHVDQNYINRLTPEQLRMELNIALHKQYALLEALQTIPAVASPDVTQFLSTAAVWPEDNNLGKLMQREHGLDAIPPVSECEGGAGLWWRIRQGLLTARPESLNDEREALATGGR